MFHRAARICLEILAGLVLVVVAGLALAAWRLSQGPISLAMLTPYIGEALEGQLPGLDLVIGDTVIAWQGWDHGFGLRLRDVEARTNSGLRVAAVADASVELSIPALLTGRIVPLAAETDGLRMALERDADGEIRLRGQREGADAAAAESAADAPDVFAWVKGGAGGQRLRRVELRNAEIELADLALGAVWRFEKVNVTVTTESGGARLVSSLGVTRQGETLRLAVDARADADARTLQAGIAFSDLRMALFADLHAAAAPLSALDAPASGRIDLTIDAGLRVTAVRGDLTLGAGQFVDRSIYPEPLKFAGAKARLGFDRAADRAVLETAEINLGGPTLQASATIEALSSAPRVSGKASARRVPVDSFATYWPPEAARGARKWIVANLSQGIAEAADFEFDLRAAAADWSGLDVDRLKGEVRCSNITVNYLAPMPKVVGAGGRLTMDHRRVDIAINAGGIGPLSVQEGRIAITGLQDPDQAIDIALTVRGPVREAIQLIDSRPLGYAKTIGHEPSAFSGEATTRLKLAFPLIDRLKIESVRVGGEIEATSFGLRHVALGQDLTAGTLNARFDEKALTASGRVNFGRTPLDVELMLAFLSAAPEQQRVKASGRVPAGELAALGFDTRPFLDGPMPVTVDIVAHRGGRTEIGLEAGLDETTMAIGELGWSKPAGVAGSGRLDLVLQRERPLELRVPRVAAGDLDAAARVLFAADGKSVSRVELTRLKAGRTDIAGTVTREPGGWRAQLAGRSLDVEALLHEANTPAPAPAAPPPRLAIALRADEMFTTAERSLTEVVFDGDRTDRWHTLRLAAKGPGRDGSRAPFNIDLTTTGDGAQTLVATSPNAGAMLRGIGITENVIGGRMRIDGVTDPARADKALRITGQILDYRMVEVPAIARFLSMALITGLADSLRGEGIGFRSFDIKGWLTHREFEIEDAVASGPALGVTTKGKLDFVADQVDLEGVIVPANSINSLLGRIPVVGDVLFGPGLFAATYTAKGPQKNPDVSINPLSAIAPGMLRRMFSGGAASDTPDPPETRPLPGGTNRPSP